MKPYSREIKKFLTEKAPGNKPADLVKMVNDQFGTEFTYPKMRAYLKNHKLRTGVPKGYGKKSSTSLYPLEVRDFIKGNYVGVGHQGMADLLNATFGTQYSKGQMKAWYARMKLNSGLTGFFKKGSEPPNKGKKGIHLSPQTEFRKGHIPRNHMSVGSEVVHTDGYLYRKIKEPNVWKQVHRINWEKANGTIPAGMKLIFLDGVRLHVELENLMLISNAQHAVMNKQNLRSEFAEITKTSLIVADLYLKMGTARRRKRK